MKKTIVSMLFLGLMLSVASVAQAYVFQLYDSTGANPTYTASDFVTFSKSVSSTTGRTSETSYFSILPSYAGGSPMVTVGLTYGASGSPWEASYEIALKSNLGDALVWGGGSGYGSGSGTENQNVPLLLKTVYGFTIFSEAGGGSSNLSAKLSLPAEKPANTPIPAAVWLLGTGLVGLVGVRRKMAA